MNNVLRSSFVDVNVAEYFLLLPIATMAEATSIVFLVAGKSASG